MTDTATKIIALVSTFAGRACLAAAIAIAALTQPLAPANAASAEERTPAGAALDFNEEDGTLYIDWSGPIRAGMADYLRTALGKYGRSRIAWSSSSTRREDRSRRAIASFRSSTKRSKRTGSSPRS